MVENQNPSSGADIRGAFRRAPLWVLWVFLVGALLGCLSSVVAIARTSSGASHADYTCAMAMTFSPLVGLWCGWMRRSWLWAVGGIVIGLGLGGCYGLMTFLFDLANFRIADSLPGSPPFEMFSRILLRSPCLLSGVAAVVLGQGTHSWCEGVPARFCKGLVAGFALGLVYCCMNEVLCRLWFPLAVEFTKQYHRMMWHNGPIAMSVAGGLYLVLFMWASNLRSPSPKS